MTQEITFDIDLGADDALNRALEIGLQYVRCSLTGQIVSVASNEAIQKAIAFERFQRPFQPIEQIIDSLETRWLIQSSRPAPHLTAAKSKDGFRFLREFYPVDLFAILASRLVFENMAAVRELESTDLKLRKMQWLVEFQNWQRGESEQLMKLLDTLIQLDAIHNIRHALYSLEVRDTVKLIRDNEFNFDTFAAFVDMVENCGFIALSTMKNPPNGNSMALSAAIALIDMTPEQLVLEEEKDRKVAANRMLVASANARNSGKSGKVTVNRGLKAVISLAEVRDVLPPTLAAKYAEQLEKRRPKKAATTGDSKPKSSKAVLKAAERFGDINFDF